MFNNVLNLENSIITRNTKVFRLLFADKSKIWTLSKLTLSRGLQLYAVKPLLQLRDNKTK